jgi:hypothetical protein
MRQKILKISSILLLGIGLTSLQAQTMYVKESSGTQTAYTLNSIRKMTFSGGNSTIQKRDKSSRVYALNGLRYLNFKDLTTSIPEQPVQLADANLIAYPNPVTDVLNIDLSSEETAGIINIISLDSKVMQTINTNGKIIVKLNISDLAQGIYLCRYSNTLKIKTVKIIKQ